MVINAVAVEVAERLDASRVAFVLLKSNALFLAACTMLGARRCMDVDVLIPSNRVHEVRALLLAGGYRAAKGRDGAHQLSPLFHPSGVMVELHTLVKHMRLTPGGGWVCLEDLERAGHLRPLPKFGAGFIPSPSFLAAHALIHGLVQHWRQVGDYPLLRLLGDVEDLSRQWENGSPLAESVSPWLAAEAVEAEGRAVFDALDFLANASSAATPDTREKLANNLFLRHVLASRYDAAYRDAVRAAAIFWVDSNRSRTVALARKIRNRLFLTEESTIRRYGPRKGPVGRVLLRLWRPLELVGKSFALLLKYWEYRFRSLDKRSI